MVTAVVRRGGQGLPMGVEGRARGRHSECDACTCSNSTRWQKEAGVPRAFAVSVAVHCSVLDGRMTSRTRRAWQTRCTRRGDAGTGEQRRDGEREAYMK